MVVDGLIEVQDTTIVKDVNQGKPTVEPLTLIRRQGKAKMMRVFFGERDQWRGEPLHEAIVKRLRMMDVSGATVYRGILGYGSKGEPHRPHMLHISEDLPIMISVIDSESKIADAAAAIEEMLGDGLIAVSDVDIVRLVYGMPKEASDADRSNG
jgi:PII-like signaling protein